MNIIYIAGNHPRHQYIARKLDSLGYLAAMVVQERGAHTPDPPDDLNNDRLRDLFIHHFDRRRQAELNFFQDAEQPDVPKIKVDIGELNSPKMWEFVDEINAELAISYGCKYLDETSLDKLPDEAWNVHGGHSPMYKGAITHFWPSYMLEPQMTVVTLHRLAKSIDSGDVVHHTQPSLVRGDGIHELACRTVKKFADDELPAVIDLFSQGEWKEPQPQERHGKFWYGADWRPEHLIPVYEKFDNSIVDMYLDGDIEGREPEVFQQPIDK